MPRAVILLKSPPRDPDQDAYFQQLISSGYNPYFIEVLESAFTNEKELVDIICAGPKEYVGVVVTSNRAAEAWIHALKQISLPGNWEHIPFYVVGEATAHTLRHTTTSHPNHFSEEFIIGAAQSGKSESLAAFVLDDLPRRGGRGKLLYLTGDKNRDTFNRMMGEGGVDIESLCVYETMAANDLEETVNHVAREILKEYQDMSPWIVFFAPSSSDFALPHLSRHFQWSDTVPAPGTGMGARLAAIGPTTANFLRTERCLRVDAVASKPNPAQLVQAIRDADKDLQ